MCAVVHVGQLAQRDGGAVFAGDDDAAEVFGPLHTCVDLHHTFLLRRADGAQRQLLVLVAHGIGHLVGSDAIGFERLRVQVGVDFAACTAHQADGAHAAHVFQTLFQHLVGPVGQLDGAGGFAFAGVGHDSHRPDSAAGRVKPQYTGLFHFSAQQRAHGGHFFAHVFSGFAAIDVQMEFNDDYGCTFVAA